MKNQNHRVFIKDLPETVTPSELESSFTDYGEVKSVEIKQRAPSALKKNQSLFFAYVNIETDDSSLQKCFQDFSQSPWHGRHIELQVAKENFLDRLKREREEAGTNNVQTPIKPVESIPKTNGLKTKPQQPLANKSPAKRVYKSSSSSSSDDDNDNGVAQDIKEPPLLKPEDDAEFEPIIIKNNKGRSLRNGLTIESLGYKPIVKIESKKRKKLKEVSGSELKRVNSIKEMIKGYQQQKSLIKNALSCVDAKPKNRIIFNDDGNDENVSAPTENGTPVDNDLSHGDTGKKNVLFGEDDDEAEDESYKDNFNVDPQFEGKQGKQLLSLQSKFKNDKRFKLDERFIEDQEVEQQQIDQEDEEISLQEEKRKEMAILESVLGGKIKQKSEYKPTLPRGMVRFDPTKPEHSKYEIPIEIKEKKKKKDKRKVNDEEQQEIEQPIVSKEVFYKVTDNLKETLEQKQEFSLLGMLGRDQVEDVDEGEIAQAKEIKKQPSNVMDSNPFKYDSSDDEGGDQADKKVEENLNLEKDQAPKNFWSEPFFFKEDDFRLQDADDFMKRMACENEEDFPALRRKLKEVVRAKVRNNQRRDKPFKKKLGGNKRKKMIRIKKAIKR